ncbi:MAG: rhodanese-like domain-containing protein [Pseudomonadota bacterium]
MRRRYLLALSGGTALTLTLPLSIPRPARAAAGTWSVLMAPEAVRGHQEAGAAVIDVRMPPAYGQGHVPGAVNLPYPAWRGPRQNPGSLIPDDQLTRMLQWAGVAGDTPVILVNEGDSPSAFGATARVYWTLKSAGLQRIAIVNGGYRAWAAAGLALSATPTRRVPSTDVFRIADTWAMDRAAVRAVVEGQSDALLIDARPDAFFNGRTRHPAAGWAGTLQGAVNLVHDSFFGSDGTLREDRGAVRTLARAAGWAPGRPVVSFCNTGHWAATNWFALSEIGGIENVRLYPESMVGWSRAFGG